MTEVTSGAQVAIHYTGTLEDGSVFDSSEGRDPLSFTVGSGMIIPGLDKALPGMTVGEKKKVTIAPEEAYGPRHDQAVMDVPRSDIPAEIPLEVGLQLQMSGPQGQPIPVTVTALTEESVTLDANHALAGKTLIFDFELVSIG
ncbi:FKBP-type peptidyl-prolyl cis-trans isomerase SlyD [Aliiroseovarius sp. xm-m-379]|uniref:Peptidyl-prolyl cis-trans isomerase n=1 Tax=Aliiroseovarius crassostreae TaxID=154981 RepID=A0A0P7IW95_9RHOB|nr:MULTISPECIES: peptidylprolyl isomerase [Aliiroseovarius]KPN63663.1 peptidylprolyl isomerase [Aliiroseovarius crassostreae]NRP13934.1 FKBP-type peptidyl-prolyl cis-trans isomerase SlyD [Aliiroseovarius sp. xm-d-517]NRP25421.1 FKBP-type peptidyl-prolyl cis-trans isomerase SlyD [Aliiroseovarius sp. xm-m-379]NRP29413.1 FKBP-type peptidyl-prolyl cis-trans isomerase SlyD [Aliiroseovarius sp. xm-m-314]NRP34220.1 FKBP-type peptidyl-prolyl cis-trans isomerase SlyD [Aliiroseovarius sp. xm-a-104]